LGLISKHSYGVIAAAYVQDGAGNEIYLVQLRNPWGGTEWNGDWSDQSDKWTPQLKDQLGWSDEDDGTFWMDYEDVKRFFSRCQVCHINDNYVYSYLRASGDYQCFGVTITTSGEYTFSISQRGERMFPENSGYKYSNCRLYLVRQGETMEYIAGKTHLQTRDGYLNVENLAEGNYLLYCEVDWLSSTEEQSFVATCYGADSVNFAVKTD